MKKTILSIVSAITLCIAANAQEYEFVPGWFTGVQGGAQYTAGEGSVGDLISPTASLNVGYQFKQWFGLRGDINAWQAKGWMPAINEGYKYKYGQLGIDAVFNLADFGKTFKPKAVNPYVFVGLGGMLGTNNDEINDLLSRHPDLSAEKKWDNSTFSGLGRFGAGIDFRLSHRVLLGLEVTDNLIFDKMNSKKGDCKVLGIGDCDYNISAQIGLKIALGKTYKNRADEIAAANAAAAAEAARLAAEKAAADKAAAEKAAAERAAAERAAAEAEAAAAAAKAAADAEYAKDLCIKNVQFKLNKSNIQKSEREKIDEIVECLNKYPEAKVKISGHADKQTGTPSINMSLSQKRAENVAKAITAAGISADRVIVEYFGDTANPYPEPEANRVAICVANRTF